MTVYSPTDYNSISVPAGCGQTHLRGDDAPAGTPMSVDCAACEPLILGLGWGWASIPEGVALTPDERAEYERATEIAQRNQALTWQNPATLAEALRGTVAPAAQPSILEQIAAMSPAEKAAVAALLNPAPTQDDDGDGDPDGKPTPPAPAKKTAPAKKATPAAGKD